MRDFQHTDRKKKTTLRVVLPAHRQQDLNTFGTQTRRSEHFRHTDNSSQHFSHTDSRAVYEDAAAAEDGEGLTDCWHQTPSQRQRIISGRNTGHEITSEILARCSGHNTLGSKHNQANIFDNKHNSFHYSSIYNHQTFWGEFISTYSSNICSKSTRSKFIKSQVKVYLPVMIHKNHLY